MSRYDDALYAQMAANPGPVVRRFSEMIREIIAELTDERGNEWGTDDILHHPVFILMADKIQSMAGYGFRYSEAYDAVARKAEPKTLQLWGIPAREEVS